MAILTKQNFDKGVERLHKHFGNVAMQGTGSENQIDITDTVEALMPSFAKNVYETRRGIFEDRHGEILQPENISLAKAVKAYFGILPSKDATTKAEKEKSVLRQFFHALDIDPQRQSFRQIAKRFGADSLSAGNMENLLIDHASFNNPTETGNIQSDHRFIIPELFTAAIRTAYEHSSMHGNWIAGMQNMSNEQITMPQILRGDGMPSKIAEGANIPVGSVRFGKKTVNIFKIGTGFGITDELLMASNLDLIFLFLEEVGIDMSIGADSLAMDILTNGEQPSQAESAPVIGVEDTLEDFQHIDIDRPITRMSRLKTPVTRIIASESDALQDLNSGKLNRNRELVGQYANVPVDTWVLPTDQMLFLNAARAMVKLQYGGFKVERERKPSSQEEMLYITDWINFAIVKRDARVFMDKSVAYAGQGFPTYMDIDSRIAETFKEY